jgi:hypothetical protein
MTFAALEALANASVLTHLANAVVRIGGVDVPGIFRNPSSVASLGNGAADTGPTVAVASSAVPDNAVDQLIEINGVPFSIANPAPDGTGMTVLTVECLQ